MKAKHTPGPWKLMPGIDPGTHVIEGVASIYGRGLCPAANARLIAAAPELLAALEVCVNFIENVTDDDPERSDKFFAAREAWRNAFAKARSE